VLIFSHMEPKQNKDESVISPLKKLTPLSKYLAMTLFILMPFVGGLIGYHFAPEKIVEVEITNNLMQATSNSDSSKDIDVISDSNQEFSFSLTPYHSEQKTNEEGPQWINIYNSNKELHYSFIGGEEVSGEHCYLGLCNTVPEDSFMTESGVVWNKINTKDCVGGCDAIASLSRVTREDKNYYFIIWENSDEKDGLAILKTFEWK
jgi:hypothetical protein